ncbi:hypothetical protein FBU59_006054, partial [Linderina macrospora]
MVQPKFDDSADRTLELVSLSRANSFDGTMSRTRTKREQLKRHVRIIAATHFLPFSVHVSESTPQEPYEWTVARRGGHTAMYAGIRSLSDQPNMDCTKVGWIGSYVDAKGSEHPCDGLSEESKRSMCRTLLEVDAVPVFIDEELAYKHYEGFSKQVLWPLLHYMAWNDAQRPEPTWWASYQKVNELFAKVVSSVYVEGDI